MDNVYSTKQIARMLRVSDEAVRRWVRYGKLVRELNNGKKGGYLVTESELKSFLRTRPKYSKTVIRDSELHTYTSMALTQRIIELEDLISNLQQNLEELKEIRDSLK